MSASWCAVILSVCLSISSIADEGNVYTSEEIGVSLRLPSEEWKLTDHSQGIAKVLVFSPVADLSTRCSLLYMPLALLPDGLLTRETQIQGLLGEGYKRVDYAGDTLDGKEVKRLVYAAQKTTTKEYGLRDKDFYFIFQLCAPDTKWQDSDVRQQLEGIKTSLKFIGSARLEAPTADRSLAEQIRTKRRALQKRDDQAFEVMRHELAVEIEPGRRTLKARDRITIGAKRDGLTAIVLVCSVVSVDRVESAAEIEWQVQDAPVPGSPRRRSLIIKPRQPLSAGERIVVTVHTSSADYVESTDQKLVKEVAILGQVRESSSYSSHIAYYPVDEVNDAAMDISLTVPTGYTAVTGGSPGQTESHGDHTTYRYRTDVRRPRALPFGFAVGKYSMLSGRSKGGLQLTVYGYPGEEKLVQQRVQVAVECANIFERMMGLLPWDHVHIAHVTPERKETGVSLPGLILISDMFFGDFSEADLSDGNLNRPDALSLLVVADELSHQWNFYAVPLPNELAEGVSTYTNALFVEHRHGPEAYRKAIRFCRDAYLASKMLGKDVAIADPDIYTSDAYRGIAFCKIPAVLDMLRTELGDEVFFGAWRKAFQQFNASQDGYKNLQHAFANAAGRDLSRFFDQWFFTAGIPKIALDFSQTGKDVEVVIRQVQPGQPYELRAILSLHGRDGETLRKPVNLAEASTTVHFTCGFEVARVEFDPDELLLKEMEAQ